MSYEVVLRVEGGDFEGAAREFLFLLWCSVSSEEEERLIKVSHRIHHEGFDRCVVTLSGPLPPSIKVREARHTLLWPFPLAELPQHNLFTL